MGKIAKQICKEKQNFKKILEMRNLVKSTNYKQIINVL